MSFIVLIILGVLASGWMVTEYNLRALRTRHKLLLERQARLDRQVEELHMLLQNEQNKVGELTELSADANDYRMQLDSAESEVTRLSRELQRHESTLIQLRHKAMSREYFGNSLGKIIITLVDKIVSPDKEVSEQLSESAKTVFHKAKRAMNG